MQHSLEKIFHFDSALLDVAAAGDINASAPDEDILKVSRALPIYRYNWWAPAEASPELHSPRTRSQSVLKNVELPSLGTLMPWWELNLDLPVSHCGLHSRAEGIDHIYKEVIASAPQSIKISHIDSFQAYL